MAIGNGGEGGGTNGGKGGKGGAQQVGDLGVTSPGLVCTTPGLVAPRLFLFRTSYSFLSLPIAPYSSL